mgnify:CR=1 FL=1
MCSSDLLPSMLLARQGATAMKGKSQRVVREAAATAIPELTKLVQPFARAAIEQHRANGDKVVLATTTPYDDDIDDDAVAHVTDADVDGDGIPNGADDDVDGDGILNGSDLNVDGDRLKNNSVREFDIDGDGLADNAAE